jgi:membrane protein implicated in regulation of membrane protease activity
VLSWIILGAASIWYPLAGWLLLLEAAIYGTALAISGVQLALNYGDLLLLFGVPISIAIMHFSWGTGFLWGLFHSGINYLRTGKENSSARRKYENN